MGPPSGCVLASGRPVERREPAAFLVRPDGYVAWAHDDVPTKHEPAALPVY